MSLDETLRVGVAKMHQNGASAAEIDAFKKTIEMTRADALASGLDPDSIQVQLPPAAMRRGKSPAGDSYAPEAAAASASDRSREQVTWSTPISGPAGAVRAMKAFLREEQFKNPKLKLQITDFDAGGWFRPARCGVELTGPRADVELLVKTLDAWARRLNG